MRGLFSFPRRSHAPTLFACIIRHGDATPPATYRKGHTVKVVTLKSHKAGQGTTVTACALALALAGDGHRVALVSNDPDTRAVLALPTGEELTTEVTRNLHVIDVSRLGALDAAGLAGLVGLSDIPEPRYDVIVTDLHDQTPSRADFARVWFIDAHAVEVVTADYLALRRSTQASHAGAERHHVVLIVEDGRALTTADVRSVLNPAGDLVEVKRTAAVARQIDAGLLTHRLSADLAPLVDFAGSLMIDPATLDAADRELVALKARRTAKGKTATQ